MGNGLRVRLSTGEEWTRGNPNSDESPCTFTFQQYDHFFGDVKLHLAAVGDFLGGLEFTVQNEVTGVKRDFSCLTAHVGDPIPFDANKKIPTGFFGRATEGSEQSVSSNDHLCDFGIFVMDGCDVISREITDIKCASGGESCGATWVPDGTTDTAHCICDWCTEHNATGKCAVTFTLSETHNLAASITGGGSIESSTTIANKVTVGFFGEGDSLTNTYKASFSNTWGDSMSQATTTTSKIASDCSLNMQPGHKSIFDASASLGHLIGDITLTITVKDRCGGQKIETKQGQVVISNVPITSMITECKPHSVECAGSAVI